MNWAKICSRRQNNAAKNGSAFPGVVPQVESQYTNGAALSVLKKYAVFNIPWDILFSAVTVIDNLAENLQYI